MTPSKAIIDLNKQHILWLRSAFFDDGSDLFFAAIKDKKTKKYSLICRLKQEDMKSIWTVTKKIRVDRKTFIVDMREITTEILAAMITRKFKFTSDQEHEFPEVYTEPQLIKEFKSLPFISINEMSDMQSADEKAPGDSQ